MSVDPGEGQVSFGVLGAFAATVEGARLDLGGPKPRALLATLAVTPGKVVSGVRLVDLLWGADPPGKPKPSLQVFASQLRKVLREVGGPAILSDGTGYRLDCGQEAVDLYRFRALVATAAQQEARTPDAALATYHRADDLWRGEPLQDLLPVGAMADLVVGVRDERASALDRRYDLALRVGPSGPLVRHLEAGVQADMLREHRWAQLMVALYLDGRTGEALQAARRLGAHLRDELGIRPGAEVQAVERAILEERTRDDLVGVLLHIDDAPRSRALMPRRGGADLPALLAPLAGQSMVGRAAELATVERTVAAGGGLRSIVVSGPAGIGKSVLLAHAAQQAHLAGAVVLAGTSDPDRVLSFQPFVEMVGQWTDRYGVEVRRRVLADLDDDLTHLVPGDRTVDRATIDPELRRHRVFEAVAELVLHAAGEHPVVVLVDDAQWIDSQSAAMLRHLGRRAADADVTVLLGVRQDGEAVHVPVLGAQEPMELGGLSDGELEELLEIALGPRWESTRVALAAALGGVTSGNPFFVTELVSVLAESPPSEPIDLAGLVATYGIPVGLKHVLAQRFELLGAATTDLLRIAAVVGDEFDAGLVTPVAGHSLDAVLAVLDEATRAGVLVEVVGSLDRFRFRHDLARTYLLSTMTTSRRTRLHQHIAVEIPAGDAHAALRFHHLDQAGSRADVLLVVAAGLDAARIALDAGALEEAADLASRVVIRIKEQAMGEAGSLAIALILRGHARFGLAQPLDAATDFADARQLALGAGRTDLLVESVVGPHVVGHDLPPDASAVALIDQALELVGPDQPTDRVRLLCAAVYERMHGGQVDVQHRMVAEAAALAAGSGDAASAGLVAITEHLVLGNTGGPLLLREATVERALRCAADAGDPRLLVRALGCATRVALERDVEAFADRLHAFQAGASELRHPLYQWFALAMDSTRRFVTGDLDGADQAVHRAFDFGIALSVGPALAAYSAQLYMIRLAQGRIGELASVLEAMVAQQPELAVWRLGFGQALVGTGDLDRAAAQLGPSVACGFADVPHDWLFLSTLGTAADLAASVGDRDAAAQVRALLEPDEDVVIVAGNAIACHGPVGRYVGLLDHVLGDVEQGQARLAAAEQRARAIGLTYWADTAAADARRLAPRERPG